HYYYAGTVAGQGVQMDLAVAGDSLSGSYYYDGIGAPLELAGTLQGQTEFRLEERDAGRVTGRFLGELAGPTGRPWGALQGRWTSADGKMDLPFALQAVAVDTVLETLQGERLDVRTIVPFLLAEPWSRVGDGLRAHATADHRDFVREGQKAFLDSEFFNGWGREDHYGIRYWSQELVSLLETDHFYTGGAHGNTVFAAFNFARNAGSASRFELRDLFLPGANFVAALSEYVIADLRRQGALWVLEAEDSPLAVTSFAEEDLQVFTLSPLGLEFAFAPYEVGPYAQGPFFVTVPFEALRGLLDPAGPAGSLLAP
ncbi:MAG TPA: DUF3298 domain-containing protein, partial [Trueperaceae bacterium]